jgi:hypothetical protein
MKALPQYCRPLAAALLLSFMLTGCGSSDILSYDSDTFFEQAMPTWIIPKMRDDYMGKKFIQPFNTANAIDHDKNGAPIPFPSRWAWPRKGWWPWPLPNPSPGQ